MGKSEADGSSSFIGMFKPLPYDGVAEFILPDVKCFERAIEDPFYKEKVMPDEAQFIDFSDATWTLGWEEVYIKDGVIVDMPEGDTKAPKLSDDHSVRHDVADEGIGAEMIEDRH